MLWRLAQILGRDEYWLHSSEELTPRADHDIHRVDVSTRDITDPTGLERWDLEVAHWGKRVHRKPRQVFCKCQQNLYSTLFTKFLNRKKQCTSDSRIYFNIYIFSKYLPRSHHSTSHWPSYCSFTGRFSRRRESEFGNEDLRQRPPSSRDQQQKLA